MSARNIAYAAASNALRTCSALMNNFPRPPPSSSSRVTGVTAGGRKGATIDSIVTMGEPLLVMSAMANDDSFSSFINDVISNAVNPESD